MASRPIPTRLSLAQLGKSRDHRIRPRGRRAGRRACRRQCRCGGPDYSARRRGRSFSPGISSRWAGSGSRSVACRSRHSEVGSDVPPYHAAPCARTLLLYPALLPEPSRSELWGAAVAMIRDAPMLGVGPGTFRLRYGTYLGWSEWDERIHSNNTYLEIGATTGIAGLGRVPVRDPLCDLASAAQPGGAAHDAGLAPVGRPRWPLPWPSPRTAWSTTSSVSPAPRACTGRSWASALAWRSGSDAPPTSSDVTPRPQI